MAAAATSVIDVGELRREAAKLLVAEATRRRAIQKAACALLPAVLASWHPRDAASRELLAKLRVLLAELGLDQGAAKHAKRVGKENVQR